jgi:NitT/TauT family transport system substrate-binding protein
MAPPPAWPRRQVLGALGWPLLAAASACTPAPEQALRVGAHPWLGFELLYLARAHQYLGAHQVRLVEVPNASASLRALAAGTLEGAGLTLDEVLSARARGLALQVVAVIDVSRGADVLLGSPAVPTLAALKGRRIGVEQGATGALMLDAALQRAGLGMADVTLVPLEFNEHAAAWQAHKVDALVTFEPVRSQLMQQGARPLFSSAEAPGLIVDVLAVRADVLAEQAAAVRTLVAGLFRARADWLRDGPAQAPTMAPRLHLPPADVVSAFGLIDLPDEASNRQWLAPGDSLLQQSARRLQQVMRRAALLDGAVDPLSSAPTLGSDRYLAHG